MANTVSFNLPIPGLNVANNLIVNATEMRATGIVANSTGMNVATILATDNVTANNVGPNTATHLSLIANLISMNVLSGNLQTLLSLTSNQVFCNAMSGNTGTFINVTSNQIFVNTITCNSPASFANVTNSTFVFNTFHIGNSTNYVDIYANGINYTDGDGTGTIMPAEVFLKKGTFTGTDVMINFANEVVSNCYSSMKLILWFYLSSLDATGHCEVHVNFSSDGVNGEFGNYVHTHLNHDRDFPSTHCKFLGQSGHTTCEVFSQGAGVTNGTNTAYKIEVLFSDTRNVSRIKSAMSRSLGIWHDGGGVEYIVPKISGWYFPSNMFLKGAYVSADNGSFNPLHWCLTGIRAED
jgi:hypothetical protein